MYDDNMNEDDYRQWQCDLLNEINRLLKPDDSPFYNHKDRHYCNFDHPPKEYILRSNLKLYQILFEIAVQQLIKMLDIFIQILKNCFG
jgi:hypothetical protein